MRDLFERSGSYEVKRLLLDGFTGRLDECLPCAKYVWQFLQNPVGSKM